MRIRLTALPLFVFLLSPAPLPADPPIRYVGSHTLYATLFQASGLLGDFQKKTRIVLAPPPVFRGSSLGIADLVAGKAELAGVSRALRPEEKAKGLVGTVICYDALGVYLHRDNPVRGISRTDLKRVLTGKIRNWRELGGKEGSITMAFDLLAEESATQEVVKEFITEGAAFDVSMLKQFEVSGDRLAYVAGNPLAMTIVGLGWHHTAPPGVRENVRVIPLDGVSPNDRTVNSGTYILSRPSLLVTVGFPKDQVKKFIDFVISPEGQAYVGKSFTPVIVK